MLGRSALSAGCSQAGQPGCSAFVSSFPEYRSIDRKVGALCFGQRYLLNRVARDTDRGSRDSNMRKDHSRIRSRDIIGAQMHAICSAGDGYVDTRVNQ